MKTVLKVKEEISKDNVSVLSTDPVNEVADIIINHEVDPIAIYENGNLRGLVNERDITACVVSTGSNPNRETAKSLFDANDEVIDEVYEG
jgi:predicted transcriptional regulator